MRIRSEMGFDSIRIISIIISSNIQFVEAITASYSAFRDYNLTW
jgi:hypothetical protein